MFEEFPYTNFHELNLDWIIKIAKDFLDQYTNIQQTITQGLEDLDTKAEQLQALLDAWYEEHSQDIADQLTDALQDLNAWYTEHLGYLDQYLTDSIADFNTAADAKAAETIASIPDDYTALANKVTSLENNISKFSIISDGVNGFIFTINKFIDTSGVDRNATGDYRYATLDYIPVMPGDIITYRLESGHANINAISFYDYKKQYISGVSNTGEDGTTLTATVPDNAKFARFSTQITIDTLVKFDAGTFSKRIVSLENNNALTNNYTFIKNRFIDLNGKMQITTEGLRYATDFIPIHYGKIIYAKLETDHANVNAVSFYDSLHGFISGVSNVAPGGTLVTVNVPSTASYVRFSSRFDIDTFIYIDTPYMDRFNIPMEEALLNNVPVSVESLRHNLPAVKNRVTLPVLSFMTGIDCPVFSDGYKYSTYADFRKLKNVSSNTYYVQNNNELITAINNAAEGDTIFLENGVYILPPITKSINIIAINKGRVYLTKYVPANIVATETPGVYSVPVPSDPQGVYFKMGNDEPIKLTKTNSSSDTAATYAAYNYDISNGAIIVHLPGNTQPTAENLFIDINTGTSISIRSAANVDITFYIEGVNVWGANYALYADSSAGGTVKVIGVDSSFWHSNRYNVISLLGADGYFQRCEAAYGYRDGFNYHAATGGQVSNAIEIDCFGHDNGLEADPQSEESNNGSTIHDGGKIIRINGGYYRNAGGNIAETNPDTTSYNYGCILYDSRASDHHPTWNCDIWCANYATQYVYGCRCVGDSTYGLDDIGDGTIYYDKYTETGTTNGNVIPM